MLELNQVVMYGTTGVCTVERIEDKKIGREVKQYYVLKPVAQASSTVFVPADNEKLLSKAKKLLTPKEAQNILDSVALRPDIWFESDAERRLKFGEIISSGERDRQLLLLRSLWNRQSSLATQGKRLHIADERALKEVQRLIYDEISVAMRLDSVEETERFIKNSLK